MATESLKNLFTTKSASENTSYYIVKKAAFLDAKPARNTCSVNDELISNAARMNIVYKNSTEVFFLNEYIFDKVWCHLCRYQTRK